MNYIVGIICTISVVLSILMAISVLLMALGTFLSFPIVELIKMLIHKD